MVDVLAELRRIATDPPGEFHPLVLIGLAIRQDPEHEVVTIRSVADEFLLRVVLEMPSLGREWLHRSLDRLCDGLLPPDDQPKDVVIRHFNVQGNPE